MAVFLPVVDVKADSAVDYFDITEMVEVEDERRYRDAMAGMSAPQAGSGDDYDEEDGKGSEGLMPPPSWVPGQPPPQQTAISSHQPAMDEGCRDAPLAAMLPPELANKNVAEWFPEFRPGQVEIWLGYIVKNVLWL